jgi:hypothetical protein
MSKEVTLPAIISGTKGQMRLKSDYIGKWRIIEMSAWDQDFIDLVAPGHLTLKANGTGSFAFGAIEAEIDWRLEKIGDQERLGFSFEGWDEGNEVSGRGWAVLSGGKMDGWLGFHHGDESTFRARKQKLR